MPVEPKHDEKPLGRVDRLSVRVGLLGLAALAPLIEEALSHDDVR